MYYYTSKIRLYLEKHRFDRKVRYILTALAAVVVFITTYFLVYPALTLEKDAVCGIEEHEHTASCYNSELICGLEESEGHTHTEDCYRTDLISVCPYDEHVHSEECFDEDGNLICGLEEHTHTEECFEEERTLICGLEEYEGHQHTDSCYTEVLSCGKEMHVHGVECYADTEATEEITETEDQLMETEAEDVSESSSESSPELSSESEPDISVPLPEIVFSDTLTELTSLWHQNEDDTWTFISKDTPFDPDRYVNVHLAYNIPQGSLDIGNAVIIYKLPESLMISDTDAEMANKEENYLNQLITGSRLPKQRTDNEDDKNSSEETVEEEYLAGKYVLNKDENDKWQLVITFNDYSIEMNKSQDITGWMMFYMKGSELETDENGYGKTVFAGKTDRHDKLIAEYIIQPIDVENTDEENIVYESDAAWFDETVDETYIENETEEAAETDIIEPESITETSAEDIQETSAEDDSETEKATEETNIYILYPEQTFSESTEYVNVKVLAEEGTFPAGTTMKVKDVEDTDTVDTIVESVEGNTEGSSKRVDKVHAVDITFYDQDGNIIEPARNVSVVMEPVKKDEKTAGDDAQQSEAVVVHVDDEGKADIIEENTIKEDAVTFEADSFSIYALVYTVDFHWDVDGKEYDFSIPGGGFVSLTDLVEVLGLAGNTNDTDQETVNEGNDTEAAQLMLDDVAVSEESRKFSADVESVEFSSPELVWVGKVEDKSTVGGLKDANRLDCEYSADLTEDQIAQINAQKVEAGDWALISILPFDTEESLTVTMKTGEVFTVRVTDMQITKKVMTAAGETYEITVTCPSDSGIPKTATLAVSEITEDHPAKDKSYAQYVSEAEAALGAKEGSAGYIRLFDIKIVDENDPEVSYQPAPGTSVDVKIELTDAESNGLSVVHFADGSEAGDVIENVNSEGEAINFAAEGFSVYAVVKVGDPPGMIKSLTELDSAIADGKSFKLSLFRQNENNYFSSSLNGSGCYTVTTNSQNASEWILEKAEGDNCYKIKSDGNGYMKNTDSVNMGYTQDAADATVFELSATNNKRYYFKVKGENNWLQYSGSGVGIRLYKDNKNAENSQIAILDSTVTGDPNNLDGKSYGIMLWNGGVTGKAMMAEANTQKPDSLLPKVLTVVTSESDHNDKLYAPSNVADPITDWTFHWNSETGKYRLSANTPNGEKYLKISSNGLALVDESDASEIEVMRGSGNYANQICLKCNGKTLAYSGNVHDGFGIASDATAVGNDWMYLVETKSNNIPDGYGRTYVAEKISVSDASLSVDHINQYGDPKETLEGKYVIVYTRSWNGSGYDYFAVNGEGKLIPCHENGNVIEWVGSSQDDMLWKFIEYKDDKGKVTHYYDLYNEATGKWLAPQLTPERHLAEDPVGLIMSGRRYGEYYTPILAWDHSSYAYSSLKVDRTANNNANDESIVSCRRTDPDSADFYFALVQELNVDDTLHGVPTINNDTYGISMKMVNLDNKAGDSGYMNKFFGSSAGGVGLMLQQGLLSTELADNGYPDVINKPGNNLKTLFSDNGAIPANHLFIESTYRETGYYVYDSTQNFATFNTATGNFTVYDQLGTHDSTSKETLKHGQFFPYNDLQPGVFSEKNRQNLYQIDGIHQLDDDDPRKYEQLYLIENPDYYFGMELEASFEQTPSGLDAWGHDIIFEFSGDDDFWLYVDGELVIDLGGIHSAVSGSVNFRTGDVNVNGKPTTLYNLFLDHYMKRGMTEEAASDLLLNGRAADPENGIEAASPVFTQKDGKYIFTDYSSHTMRIFYFERGASASNLHMKFNLAAVKKGAVQLSKEVENVASASELLFPYQIYYRFPGEQTFTRLTNSTDAFRNTIEYYEETYPGHTVDISKYDEKYVFHKGSEALIDFDPYLKIGNQLYEDVFFLSPDKPAEITFPTLGDDSSRVTIADYYIVECGIDPNEYKKVTVNEEVVTGTPVSDQVGIYDYATTVASPAERSSVRYVNEAETPGSLKFTKVIHDPEGNEMTVEQYYAGHPDGRYYENGPTFDFRLYFGSPFDTSANTAAYMYVYRVKDPEGMYCHWNPDLERFERIRGEEGSGYENGTDNFNILSEDRIEGNTTIYGDKTLASFDSSTYGAITQIPPYYTVEVLDLVPGLWYKVIERPTETPDGYRLYKCVQDGVVIEEDQWATGIYEDDMTWRGVDGRIETNIEEDIKIGNKEGYGLRINKTWTDAKTITNREPTYFAVYKAGTDEHGAPTFDLVEDSVRQMAYTANPDWQTLVWYYDSLPEGGTLGDYWVYEVALTVAEGGRISVAQNGVVSGYATCTPVGISASGASDNRPPVAEDGLNLKVTSAGAEDPSEIYYKATYGESTPYPLEDSKVRNFTAVNEPKNRPVIRLKKEKWNDEPLAGATFSLVEVVSGDRIGGNLVSGNNGLFDPEVIYLDYGRSYTLTETKSPNGYIGMQQSLTITMPEEPAQGTQEGDVTVSPAAADISYYYELTQKTETEPPTLTIKNRPYELKILKADTSTEAEPIPLAGAKFKLYKYRLVNGDTLPIGVNGWAEASTDESGYLDNLPTEPGDYALEELMPPSGYKPLGENDWIRFSISQTGVIGQPTSEAGATLTGPVEVTGDATGLVVYTITIPNTPIPMYLKKVDASGEDLTGAKFSLSRLVVSTGTTQTGEPAGEEQSVPDAPGVPPTSEDQSTHQPWQIVSGYSEIDMTSTPKIELTSLPKGVYCLTETLAPEGYVIYENKTYFKISDDRSVTLTNADGTGSNSNSSASIDQGVDDDNNTVYIITVENTPGTSLPNTGGPGTRLFTILGMILIAGAALILWRRRRTI